VAPVSEVFEVITFFYMQLMGVFNFQKNPQKEVPCIDDDGFLLSERYGFKKVDFPFCVTVH
jgi:hypothetical protein